MRDRFGLDDGGLEKENEQWEFNNVRSNTLNVVRDPDFPEDTTAKGKKQNYTCCSKQLKGQRGMQFKKTGIFLCDLKGLKLQSISFDSCTFLSFLVLRLQFHSQLGADRFGLLKFHPLFCVTICQNNHDGKITAAPTG